MKFLSHLIDNDTPTYGNSSGIKISHATCMDNGDTANSLSIKMNNPMLFSTPQYTKLYAKFTNYIGDILVDIIDRQEDLNFGYTNDRENSSQ